MHIGFLTNEYILPGSSQGGLAHYTRKVGLALAARGHQITILALSEQDACWQDETITICEVQRATFPRRLRRLRYLRLVLPMLTWLRSARRVRNKVWEMHRQRPFDLLHTTPNEAPGAALCHNKKLPLVCRCSSYRPLIRAAYGRQRTLPESLTDWLEIRQVLDADAAFAPSQFIANAFARLEARRPQVIRTPLDDTLTGSMDDSYYQLHLKDTPYLLFFGGLSRIKGVDLLADVIPSVLAQHESLRFVFIGRDRGMPDGQPIVEYLRARCSDHTHRLHYHAALPQTQLAPIIANALGVLMPSRVDNYPNACLEAQLFGVPVIGTYHSSLDEMVQEGVTGFLAQNEDPDSLRAAIDRLLAQTPDQQASMRQRILAHIQAIAAEDRIGQLIAFYETVCQQFKGQQ